MNGFLTLDFEYALPRDETSLRLSAEATDGMSSDELLKKSLQVYFG